MRSAPRAPSRWPRTRPPPRTRATENAAKVEQSAGDKVNSAQTVVRDEKTAEAHTAAVETERVADAKAQGEHKVALAQCESLSGEPQKACKEQADTAFQVAEDQARQAEANTDPKP